MQAEDIFRAPHDHYVISFAIRFWNVTSGGTRNDKMIGSQAYEKFFE